MGPEPRTQRAIAFRPLYTASKWSTLLDALGESARRVNGTERGVPRLTNRDAIALLAAFRRRALQVPAIHAMWHQLAAPAYGWHQSDDALLVDDDQGAKPYEYKLELWRLLHGVVKALAADEHTSSSVELEVTDAWDDPNLLGRLTEALKADGNGAALASAPSSSSSSPDPDGVSPARKMPIPGVCKDPKTGKTRLMRPGEKCEPAMIDDPITALVKWLTKKVGKPLLLLGGVYVGARVVAALPSRAQRRTPLLAGRRRRKKRSHGNARRTRALLA